MGGAGASSNKKARQAAAVGGGRQPLMSDLEQIAALREHLRSPGACPPGVDPDGRAVRSALDALEKEGKKIERDEKLRKKFAAAEEATTKAGGDDAMLLDDEWQDVPSAAEHDSGGGGNDDTLASSGEVLGHHEAEMLDPPPPEEEESALGTELGSAAVASVAASSVLVRDPLSAVALAIHAALVSDAVGFRCTGIPLEKGAGGGGFAAPIRDLPKSKLVPDKWDGKVRDAGNARVLLRYRKDGVGSAVLTVRLRGEGGDSAADVSAAPTSIVSLTFGPSAEAPAEPLEFPLDRHVNLDGLAAALRRDGRASPALHYKALGRLLSDVAATFDLGHVGDASGEGVSSAMIVGPPAPLPAPVGAAVGATAVHVPPDGAVPSRPTGTDPLRPSSVVPPIGGIMPGCRAPRIEDLDPTRGILPGGDFAGDLAPGGIVEPRLGGVRPGNLPDGGGSLMGPNHPSFRGGAYDYYDDDDDLFPGGPPGVGGGGIPRIGGTNMQPRFDPYLPPGVAPPGGVPGGGRGIGGRGMGRGGRGRGRGRGRVPRSGGDPNPDHQMPPSDLGGNMFM